MFCEFETTCHSCATSVMVSVPLSPGTDFVPLGSVYSCTCPECGAHRGGPVCNFEPRALRARRSPDTVEGTLSVTR